MNALSSPFLPLQARLVQNSRAVLGEGPLWDVSRRALWWVDIAGRRINRHDQASLDFSLKTPCQVGCLGLCEDGGLIAGMEHGIALFEPHRNSWRVIAPLEAELQENRVNDGKVDPQGRFVAGTMSTTRALGSAALYQVDGSGFTRRLRGGLTISNGLDWSPDGEMFYLVDSIEKTVRAFEWREGIGPLLESRVVVDAIADAETRLLDGLCVDAEGMLWIAHFGAGRVARWDPRTGRELVRVQLPAPRVTSCAFGGPRLDTLFVTTARIGLDAQQLAEWPLSGGLFAIDADVPGLPPYRFRQA